MPNSTMARAATRHLVVAVACIFAFAPTAESWSINPTATSTLLPFRSTSQGMLPSLRRHRGRQPSRVNLSSSPGGNEIDGKDIVQTVLGNLEDIKRNTFEGDVGKRGEAYVAAQFATALFILIGSVPVVGDLVTILLGPVLLALGAGVILVALYDLGPLLSPWPVPSADSKVGGGNGDEGLISTGMFQYVRHPIYAGLLASAFGLSVWTSSIDRLLLTGLLFLILDAKSDFEETKLRETFGEAAYNDYAERVSGKFVPHQLVGLMPWSYSAEGEGKETSKGG